MPFILTSSLIVLNHLSVIVRSCSCKTGWFGVPGHRRLEVRGHGAGPTVLVGVHTGLRSRHLPHHSASTVALRHHQTHRHSLLQDCQEENANDDGSRRGLNLSISDLLLLVLHQALLSEWDLCHFCKNLLL